MSSALSIPVDDEKLKLMDDVVKEASLDVVQHYGQFKQALVMAAAVRKIGDMITDDMMADVMALQNTSLGFRTDKDPGGYNVAVVKSCMIEAVLRGVRVVGNEMNIISGRLYITKEGCSRLVREYPGLANLKLMPGVPAIGSTGALVDYRATWTLNGEQQHMDRVKSVVDDHRIPVKVNKGMGVDAVLGKATRKMLAAIYGELTGTHEAVPEGDVDGNGHSKSVSRSGATDVVAAMSLENMSTPLNCVPPQLSDYEAALEKAPNVDEVGLTYHEHIEQTELSKDDKLVAIALSLRDAARARLEPAKQKEFAQ